MPEIQLGDESVDRFDGSHVDEESDDDIVTILINIYEAEELTLSFAGHRLE